MAIDASIYSRMRSPANLGGAFFDAYDQGQAAQERGMRLSDLARQQEKQKAIDEAYAKNTGADGTINRQGLVSDLGKAGAGREALEMKADFDAKDQLAQKNKFELDDKKMLRVGQLMESVAHMKPEQRAALAPKMHEQLVAWGVVDPSKPPNPYNEDEYQGALRQFRQRKEYQEGQKMQAEIGNIRAMEKEHLAGAAAKGREGGVAALSPLERLGKAGADVKQKIGHITSGLQALTKYEDEFRKGGRQKYVDASTPLVGGIISSTPIDEARTSMEEAIGRLASGGAINKDEEARFRRMLPRAGDSDEDAARKLVDLRRDMEGKLTAYGFQTGELKGMGYDPTRLGYETDYAKQEGRGLFKPKGKGKSGVAIASEPPDFNSMSDAELKQFLGGK